MKGVDTHEIRFSIDVSIGFVFRDLRKDERPGVRAKAVDGIEKSGICECVAVWEI